MRAHDKVRVCFALNLGLLASIGACIAAFASDGAYFRAGPSPGFVLVGVAIDTPERYAALLVLLCINSVIKVIVGELGEPVLVFNVYNPDKRVILDFTRAQLLFYANAMFLVSNARRVLEVLITVAQIDVAVFAVLIEQAASTCTVCFLVSEKTFTVDPGAQAPLTAAPSDSCGASVREDGSELT